MENNREIREDSGEDMNNQGGNQGEQGEDNMREQGN